jgi:hypothetical protein
MARLYCAVGISIRGAGIRRPPRGAAAVAAANGWVASHDFLADTARRRRFRGPCSRSPPFPVGSMAAQTNHWAGARIATANAAVVGLLTPSDSHCRPAGRRRRCWWLYSARWLPLQRSCCVERPATSAPHRGPGDDLLRACTRRADRQYRLICLNAARGGARARCHEP